jgi:PKD domain
VRPLHRLLAKWQPPRRSTLFALLTTGLATLILVAVPTAGAVTSEGFGMDRRAKATFAQEPLQYHGGPVLHNSNAYAIYWDPIGIYREDWQQLINRYLYDVGAASGTLGNVFALEAQYTDSSGRAANQSTFRGAYTDKTPYPITGNCSDSAEFACLTDTQIQAELQKVITSGVLPGATGPAVYYILTPPGVTVCTDGGGKGNCSDSTTTPPNGICGYHSVLNPGGAAVPYAVQPWTAGNAGLVEGALPASDVLSCQDNSGILEEPNQLGSTRDKYSTYAAGLPDVMINDLSILQRDVVVDPMLNGWYQTATGAEQGDGCQWDFGPPPESAPSPDKHTHAASLSDQVINGHSYYLQWAFNSADMTVARGLVCWPGVALEPQFTFPNPVNSGDVAGFDATESFFTFDANPNGLPPTEPYQGANYSWNFGDGTSVSGGASDASVFHSYQYGGTYTVTLTLTDGAGNVASIAHQVVVNGPPAPSAAKEATGSGAGATGSSGAGATGSSGGSGGATSGGGSSSVGSASVPPPFATAAAVTHSLRSALRKGLVIRYSVNEQVAGHFEVLLRRSIARRLGIGGSPAFGLPAGTPPQVIIGRAVLVTTAAGRSTVDIQFSKRTASRLGRMHSVSLMLRLFVRNAASHNPATTTVLSTVTLSH